MKTNLLVLALALALTATGGAQTTCDDWVSQGRAKLAAHDLTNANICFSNAVLQCPSHQPANVFYAVTRLLVLPNGSPIESFLTRLGVGPTNRNPYAWTASIATNANGHWRVPANVDAEEAALLVRTNILPQIAAAATNLAKVTDHNFLLSLTRSDTASADVQLDYGDILMLQALLRASEYAGYTIYSWNWDVQLAAVEALVTNQTLGVQRLLADYPQLLTFATTNDLAAARRAFTNAVDLYMQASSFIRSRPTIDTRLFNYDAEMADNELKFRESLADLKSSLSKTVVLQVDTNYSIHLARHFDGSGVPRTFLPAFTNNAFIEGTLPDPTFGGLVFGVSRTRVDEVLSKCIEAKSPDARFWTVAKGQLFDQTNSGSPVSLPSNPFMFHCKVQPGGSNTVISALVQSPDGTHQELLLTDGSLSTNVPFASQSALDAAYPNGAYTLTMLGLNDGTRTSRLDLVNNAYPTTPRIQNFQAAQALDATRDFTLVWDPLVGGTNGFIQVKIADAMTGSLVFKTPDAWKADALRGNTVSLRIPANTLSPGQNYSAQLLFVRSTATDTNTILAGSGAAAYFKQTHFTLATTDVRLYGVRKGQRFVQTSALAPVLATSNAYYFDATVVTEGYASVTGAAVGLPNAVIKTLDNSYYYFSFLALTEAFNSKSDLDANYPNGPYALTIDSSFAGSRTATVSLPADAYPTTPHISNYAAAQSVDGRADFTLRWDAFAGGTTNDFIRVIIGDNGSGGMTALGTIFNTPDYLEPGALNGTATTVVIPRKTFYAGETLTATLVFGKRVGFDTNGYPGAIGIAAYYKITSFSLHATNGLPAPDLLPTSLTWTGPAEVGQSIQITVTVRNNGAGPVKSPWPYGLYLSADNAWDSSDVPLTNFWATEFRSLASGETLTNIFSATLPNAPGTNCFLIVRVDDFSVIRESNKTNNTLAVPITLSGPDLVAMALDCTNQAEASSWIDVSWVVSNLGITAAVGQYNGPPCCGSQFWSDAIYLSTNASGLNGRMLGSLAYETEGLVPGDSYSQDNSVRLPGWAAGNYYLVLAVDTYGGVTEVCRTNNSIIRTITLTAPLTAPDLAAIALITNAPPVAGDPLPITIVVTNQGTGFAEPTWWCDFYLSSTPHWGPSARWVGSEVVYDEIAPGETLSLDTSANLPENLLGAQYLIARLDVGEDIYELNKTNNALAVPVFIQEAPPVITQQPTGLTVAEGDYAWFSVIARHARTYQWRFNDRDIPGATRSTFYINGARSSDAGQYSVLVGNTSGTAPSAEASLYVVSATWGPDLVPTALDGPATASLNDSFQVSWTVENQGNGPAQPNSEGWWDTVYVSKASTWDTNAIPICYLQQTQTLAVGTSYTQTNMVSLPPGLTSGAYYLLLRVNEFNSALETNKLNNARTAAIGLTAPDLVPTSLSASGVAFTGQSLEVNWTIQNQGDAALSPGWYDSLYFSTNRVWDANATELAWSWEDLPVAAGASYSRTITTDPLPDVPLGTYYLILRADAWNNVVESNETNNDLSIPIHVCPANIVVDNDNVSFNLNVNAGDFTSLAWKKGSGQQLCDQYWNGQQFGGPTTINAAAYKQNWSLASYSFNTNSCDIVLTHPQAGQKRLSCLWGANGLFVDVGLTTPLSPVPGIGGHWQPGGNTGDANDAATVYDGNGEVLTRIPITYPGGGTTLWSGQAQSCCLQDADYNEVIGYVYDDLVSALVGTGASADGPIYSPATNHVTFQVMVTSTNEFAKHSGGRVNGRILSPTRSGKILAGDTLRFSGRGTVMPGYGQARFAWDFGGGLTSLLQDPGLVTFPTIGTNHVVLQVSDGAGRHDSTPDTRKITVVADPGSVPDLAAVELTVPPGLAIGQPAQITYRVQNIGNGALSGKTCHDAVYLSRDPYLDIGDTLLAQTLITNSVAVGASYTNTVTVTMPALDEGVYYLLLSADDQWELLDRHRLNNQTAVATALVVPTLTNGIATTGAFGGDGDEQYFRIDVPAGQNLLVALDGGGQAVTELYVRFGSLPTRGSYDYRSSGPAGPNQQVLVPGAQGGSWYLLAYAARGGNGAYTLLAQVAEVLASKFTPDHQDWKHDSVMSIRGAGFVPGMTVELVGTNSAVYPAASVKVDSAIQLWATFTSNTVPIGAYSVRLRTPKGLTAQAPGVFRMVDGVGPRLVTKLILPSWIGYHNPATLQVEYANQGDVAMLAPLLRVTGSQNGQQHAFLTLDPSRRGQSFWTNGIPDGFKNSVQILAGGSTVGLLQPGESFRVPVYYAGWQQDFVRFPNWAGWDFSYPPIVFTVNAVTADDTRAVDWTQFTRPAGMTDARWAVVLQSLQSRTGNSWGGYVTQLCGVLGLVSSLNGTAYDAGRLFDVIWQQAAGNGNSTLSGQVVDAGTGLAVTNVQVVARQGVGTSDAIIHSAQTDGQGTFTFTGLPAGAYQMYVEGYHSTSLYAVTLVDQGTTTGIVLSVDPIPTEPPPPALSQINESGSQLANGNGGEAHLVWKRGSEIWHAYHDGTNWVTAAPLSNAVGFEPRVAASPRLIGGETPGVIVTWRSQDTNHSMLRYTIGRIVSDTNLTQWTEPRSFSETNYIDNQNLALMVKPSGQIIGVWQKQSQQITDDTDLYYRLLTVETNSLTWLGKIRGTPGFGALASTLVAAKDSKLCLPFSYELGSFYLPGHVPIFGGVYKGSLAGEFCGYLGCKPFFSFTGGGEASLADDRVTVSGTGSGKASWKSECKDSLCQYAFDTASIEFALSGSAAVPAWLFKWGPVDFEVGSKWEIGVAADLEWEGENFPSWPSKGSSSIKIGAGPYGKAKFKIPRTSIEAEGAVTGMGSLTWKRNSFTGESSVDVEVELCVEGKAGLFTWGKTTNGAAAWCHTWTTYSSNGQEAKILKLPLEIADYPSLTLNPVSGTTNVYEGNPVLSDVAQSVRNDGSPSVAMSEAGEVLLAWTRDSEVPETWLGSSVAVASLVGQNWASPIELPASRGFNSDVKMAIDSSGSPVVVWSTASNSAVGLHSSADDVLAAMASNHIVFSIRANGIWTEPILVAAQVGSGHSVALGKAADGIIIASWINDSGSTQTLYTASWNGVGWSAPRAVASGAFIGEASLGTVGGVSTLFWTQNFAVDTNSLALKMLSSSWDSVANRWQVGGVFIAPTNNGSSAKGFSAGKSAKFSFPFSPSSECCKSCTETNEPPPPPPPPPPCTNNDTCGGGSTQPISSSDPNAKIGSAGYGQAGFIPNGELLAYEIQFENATNATAPAQLVEIYDTLADKLDWSTFALTEIAFGSNNIAVPENSLYFETNVPITANGVTFEVQIEAGIDFELGAFYAVFSTIDPITGLPPEVTTGFLPPEDGTGRGQGHVNYTIRPIPDLPTGTQIRNIALITFDRSITIPTNQRDPHDPSQGTDPAKECLYTIDATVPSSHVVALPVATNNGDFQVSWSGEDTGGSGIATFAIYVSDNSGLWALWQGGTTNTSATYHGELDHTYGFYSSARNHVGTQEPPHALPDTVIRIDAAVPDIAITSGPVTGARLTDSVVQFGGEASDDVAVASVEWQLRNPAGTNAWQTASGTTNWSVTVSNLVFGLNTVAFRSLDVAGNLSPEASRPLVLLAPLAVTVSGWGTLANTNDLGVSFKEVGSIYTLTAVPYSGFKFTNWTGSMTVATAAVTFTMQPGWSLQANFVPLDTNRAPWLAITSHTNLQLVFGTNAVLAGIAYDAGHGEHGITNVSVNKLRATNDTAVGASIAYWSRSIPLAAGTNTFTVVARDQDGYAKTNVIRLIRDITLPTITITAPKANQNWSNAVFVASGKASDNVGIASIWYRLNTNGWIQAGGTTNWTAGLDLSLRTNTFAAYAVDTSGSKSATNTSRFYYIVSDQLLVRAVGQGKLTPDFSNAWLETGKSYTMKASGANGHKFTNWLVSTNWVGDLTNTNATLSFIMQSNLTVQANFVDTNRPTLAITSPTSNQRWSNAVFTVKGTAKDNAQVGSVLYQLNGGAWSNALTANTWTNWTAGVVLRPGTNVVRAYAVDPTGNKSLTNTASMQFVVTNRLLVSATGKGTLSLNYSNAWLEIGRNYSMKATPGSGFVFTNWVVSTNWAGSATTNNATVQFMMQSNLTLQVNFVDVTKPTITVTSPTAGQKMTNALANVKGTASDNWGVGSVQYQLNGGVWGLATSTNGWTNWTAVLPLIAGTNVIKAYAVDLGGKASTTNTVSVVSSNTFNLRLSFSSTQPMASNGLQLSLEVSRGTSGRVEVSTNLQDWTTLTSFVSTNATMQFRDSAATNCNWRFYRAVVP